MARKKETNVEKIEQQLIVSRNFKITKKDSDDIENYLNNNKITFSVLMRDIVKKFLEDNKNE